jgi:hypothetical protein
MRGGKSRKKDCKCSEGTPPPLDDRIEETDEVSP